MPPQRGTETNQLANVIEVIQLGRKTGTLTVERGADLSLEIGELTFDNGHITQARSNRGIQGQQALFWLKSWKSCRFTFLEGKTVITQSLPSVSQDELLHKKSETSPHRVPSEAPSHTIPSIGYDAELLAVPQRLLTPETALQRITQAKLSRAHRQLLLLIDEQRNVAELSRLIGRRQDEVISLLRDLAYIGITR